MKTINFNTELKNRRLLANISQYKFAKKAGYFPSKLSNIEQGKRDIDFNEFDRLMNLLGFTVELRILPK
jgi:transcriptional regulator with XRE-family HTH domain